MLYPVLHRTRYKKHTVYTYILCTRIIILYLENFLVIVSYVLYVLPGIPRIIHGILHYILMLYIYSIYLHYPMPTVYTYQAQLAMHICILIHSVYH